MANHAVDVSPAGDHRGGVDDSHSAPWHDLPCFDFLRHSNMAIFIINNDGYTYERFSHGMHAAYVDIAPWFFGVPDDCSVHTHRVVTWGELDAVLSSESFVKGKGLAMVDVHLGKYDIPEKFRAGFERAEKQLSAHLIFNTHTEMHNHILSRTVSDMSSYLEKRLGRESSSEILPASYIISKSGGHVVRTGCR